MTSSKKTKVKIILFLFPPLSCSILETRSKADKMDVCGCSKGCGIHVTSAGFRSPSVIRNGGGEESSHFLFVCRLQAVSGIFCTGVRACARSLVSNLGAQLYDPSLNNGH